MGLPKVGWSRRGISFLNNAWLLLNKTAMCILWCKAGGRNQRGTSSKIDFEFCGSWSPRANEQDQGIYANWCLVQRENFWNISKHWVFCCRRKSTRRSTGDIGWRSLEDERLCLPHKHTLVNHYTHFSLSALQHVFLWRQSKSAHIE